MATFEITEGAPGQGKSLYTARLALRLVERNKKWFAKGNPKRVVWSNIRFSEQFEKDNEGFFDYWTDTQQICTLKDCDIIWDEIATELDARNFANLTVELKRFLSQYRKRGVDIYANTQDFSMIDARARLMITCVRSLTKIIGSRDISTTKPAPKYIWGLVLIRDVSNWRETDPEKKKYEIVPAFMFITQELISLYDTRQDIPLGRPAPLKHTVLVCEHVDNPTHDCTFHRVVHS